MPGGAKAQVYIVQRDERLSLSDFTLGEVREAEFW
jgi:hypothetical protein